VNVIASNIAGDGVPGNADTTDQDFALVIYNTGAMTQPMLYKSAMRWIEAYGNADGNIQTGEVWDLEVDLNNVQGAPTASGVSAVLTTPSAGLQLLQDTSAYNNIAGGGMQTNLARYRVRVLHSLGCSSAPLSLAVTYTGGSTGITLDPLTPTPVSSNSQTYTSTAVPVAIPDNNTNGVLIPVTVDPGIVGDVNVNLSLTHTYDSDLAISLQGPGGATTVSLAYRRGSSGDNYTNTTFDDEAVTPISSGSAPFSGSFRPEAFLSAFDGLAAAGTWNLKVADMAGADTGNVTAFNLTVTTVSCTLPASTTYNYLPTIWR
jgi:subtilisin-like proprotein convertase family protein